MSKLLNSVQLFIKSNNFGGALLFFCVVISLLIANSPWSGNLHAFFAQPVGLETESIHLNYSVLTWINDALMAIFFLLVGLEIKRELVNGELSSPKKASLPILCAIGGAIVPALIYISINKGLESQHGWGIPMATDIAFALAIISLVGKNVPLGLKVFLAALAIVDDLIAILVIAIFYSSGLDWMNLAYVGIGMIVLIILNRLNVRQLAYYLIPGIFIWYFVHHSGIHATIAGVLVAMTIPVSVPKHESPLLKLEHALALPVNLLIIPIFAFANTNITIHPESFEGLFSPLGLGILLGLLVGKPLGITLFTYLCTRFGLSTLPKNCGWSHILGAGMIAGIGFTMSIFISILSFDKEILIEEAKLMVLITSFLAGSIGFFFLKKVCDRKN